MSSASPAPAVGPAGPRAGSAAVVGALVSLWLCWGTSFPAMRVMVATASGTIFLTAGLVLVITRPRALRGLGRRGVATAGGAGLCLLGAQGAVAVAVQHLPASTAALLVAPIPLWVVVLRAALGDRPSRAGVARLGLGFVGVAVVLVVGAGSPGGAGQPAGGWVWALAVVAAAVSWAAGTLWTSRAESIAAMSTRACTLFQLLTGGSALVVVGLLVGEPVAATPAAAVSLWAAFGYLVLVDSLAGFVLFTWLLRVAPVGLVSTYAYAVPVVAYLVGVVALAEPFHPAVLLGAAAIVAAIAAEVRSR